MLNYSVAIKTGRGEPGRDGKIFSDQRQNCNVAVCMYVFIKLHITTQSGPVILVILCHSH